MTTDPAASTSYSASLDPQHSALSETADSDRREVFAEDLTDALERDPLMLAEFHGTEQGIDLRIRGAREVMHRIAEAMWTLLDGTEAPNYVEMALVHPKTGKRGALTVQRQDGKTPHECRQDAERRIQAALAIDPEDHATKSRDYGRGFSEAIRQVREALA